MSRFHKHPARIVSSNHDWQKSIRCTIILKSLLIAAMVFAAPMSYAAEKSPAQLSSKTTSVKHSSPGKILPCVPPQTSRMEKSSDAKIANRVQRNAGDPTLSYAMALSIALGLHTVAGPVVKSEKAAARTANISGSSVGAKIPVAKRFTLSAGNGKNCPDRVSMKVPGDRLALE